MKKKKNNFLKIAYYSLAVYLGQFFKGLSSIFLSNFLGPVGRGQYSYTNLYYQYLQYANLGIRYSTDKNLPIIYNDKDKKEIRDYELKSRSSLLVIQTIVSILVILYIYFFEKSELKILLIVTVISSIVFYLNEFYKAIYRAEQKVNIISKYTIYYYSISGIIQLISVYFFQLQGAIYSILICNILFYIIFFNKMKLRNFIIKFDIKFTYFMIKDGFVLFINSLTVFTIMNMDKFFIIKFSVNKDVDLGTYTVATMFFAMFQILPTSITEVLFPQLIIKIKNDTKMNVGKYIENSLKIISKIFYIIVAVSVILYPLFVNIFMKKYINSIDLFTIIIIGIYFFAVQSLCSYVLIGLGKKKYVLYISLSSLVVSLIINFLLIRVFGFNLKLIALSASITYFVYSFIYIVFVYTIYKKYINNFIITISISIFKLVILILGNVLLERTIYINIIFLIDIFISIIVLIKNYMKTFKGRSN